MGDLPELDLPEGVTSEPFDPEHDTAPEGSDQDCDGGDEE